MVVIMVRYGGCIPLSIVIPTDFIAVVVVIVANVIMVIILPS